MILALIVLELQCGILAETYEKEKVSYNKRV